MKILIALLIASIPGWVSAKPSENWLELIRSDGTVIYVDDSTISEASTLQRTAWILMNYPKPVQVYESKKKAWSSVTKRSFICESGQMAILSATDYAKPDMLGDVLDVYDRGPNLAKYRESGPGTIGQELVKLVCALPIQKK